MSHIIPRHLSPTDTSAEANLDRIQHYQRMFGLTGGKGFRHPSPRIEALAHASFAD